MRSTDEIGKRADTGMTEDQEPEFRLAVISLIVRTRRDAMPSRFHPARVPEDHRAVSGDRLAELKCRRGRLDVRPHDVVGDQDRL